MPLATSFPNSAFSYGFGDEVVTGNRYYVDSGAVNASDGNLGLRPEQPFATLNGANNAVTANNGDHIYLMPGHAETISADAATDPGPDMTVAGVTVVGLGVGSDRPSFTFDNTAADFKMNAANGKIHNILFIAGVASQVMGVEVSGDDCEVSHCEFRNDGSNEMLIAVNIGVASNDSDRFYIHDCRFISDTAGSTSAISMTALQAGVRIEDNHVRGDYSDACIQSAVIHTDCVVKRNFLQNDNNTAHAIQFSTTSTGWISDNDFVTDAIATCYDQGSCFGSRNMFYDDGHTDATGTIVPETIVTGGTGIFQLQNRIGAEADTNALSDVLTGSTGVGTWGTATAYGNGVAFDEVLAYIQDSIRPPAGAHVPGLGTQVLKTGATMAATDDLFSVTDAIIITMLIGQVTTVVSGGSTQVCSIRKKTINLGMCADTAVFDDADNTIYICPFDVGIVLNGATAPVAELGMTNASFLGFAAFGYIGETAGVIEWEDVSGDATAGVATWTLYYLPLNSTSTVSAG